MYWYVLLPVRVNYTRPLRFRAMGGKGLYGSTAVETLLYGGTFRLISRASAHGVCTKETVVFRTSRWVLIDIAPVHARRPTSAEAGALVPVGPPPPRGLYALLGTMGKRPHTSTTSWLCLRS